MTLFSEPQTKTCGSKQTFVFLLGSKDSPADIVLLATRTLSFWETSMIEIMGKIFEIRTFLEKGICKIIAG